MDESGSFSELIGAVLRRWFLQHGEPAPSEAVAAEFAARLHVLVTERGLPRPLAGDERGTAGSMSEAECGPLVARVVAPEESALLREAARQLVKACFYPEFKDCRDSFRLRTADGSCRRQELPRVRDRLSGSHCIDCPHWVALAGDEHERFLAEAWWADAQEFYRHRDVYLPEDFRALRRWLWREARRGGPRPT